jgi:hypothetical protein
MKTNQGLIKLLILILIALIVLGYYGVSVRSAVENPTTQDNIGYVTTGAEGVWNNYLKVPATYLWGIFVNDIWDPAITNLEAIKNGQPTDLQKSAPLLPNPDGSQN